MSNQSLWILCQLLFNLGQLLIYMGIIASYMDKYQPGWDRPRLEHN